LARFDKGVAQLWRDFENRANIWRNLWRDSLMCATYLGFPSAAAPLLLLSRKSAAHPPTPSD
jgi:hypothetical protein